MNYWIACLLAWATTLGPAWAQRDIVRSDKGMAATLVRGKVPGSWLAVRLDDRLFYSPQGWMQFRPATASESPFPGPKGGELLHSFYLEKDKGITPSGATIFAWRADRPSAPKDSAYSWINMMRIETGEYKPKPLTARALPLGETMPKAHKSWPCDERNCAPWGHYIADFPHFQFVTETFGILYHSNNGRFYTTHDGGSTWQLTGDLTSACRGTKLFATVLSVHFTDVQTGFAVVMMERPPADYYAVKNCDDYFDCRSNYEPLPGDDFYGARLVRTADGGKTWQRATVDGDFHRFDYTFHRVRFYQPADHRQPISFYCYGDDRIFESRDGGAHFTHRKIKDYKQYWNRPVSVKEQCFVDDVHFAPFRLLMFNLGPLTKHSREAGN